MHVRTCDVTDPKAVVDVLAVIGPVHRVVHAAVIAQPRRSWATADRSETRHSTDVYGTMHIVRATLPACWSAAYELIVCAPSGARRDVRRLGAVAAYAEALFREHGGRG